MEGSSGHSEDAVNVAGKEAEIVDLEDDIEPSQGSSCLSGGEERGGGDSSGDF